jgi:hypothetical protein
VDIGVVIEGINEGAMKREPWMHHRQALGARGIHLHLHEGGGEAFRRPFDAMLLHVWQDWKNPRLFDPRKILPIMESYAAYRAEYPDTVQIVVNHTDMARRPFATPYWRPGDPVLYRTPAYDRGELRPFPPASIWPYEKVWGSAHFASEEPPAYQAGFVGTASGPKGYRERVAKATARVGIGLCGPERPLGEGEYARLMASCRIIVCPQGWGEQSLRHWDTWLSGKPMLTDRAADSVELVPGLRLREGVHYLVYDEPEEIPGLVERWTHPSRRDELAEIARNGRDAARSYDALDNMVRFFHAAVPRRETAAAGAAVKTPGAIAC